MAIRKGLLEFLILKIVAANKVYVADILERLSDTDFATQEGTLYPLLSKMRRDGLLDYEWQESDAGPPRKYYELTAKGKTQLRRAERLLEAAQRDHLATWTIAMQKVISINLNGNAYQLEEDGYDVAAGLSGAGGTTSSKTIRIGPRSCADLEQAIADKCQRFLGPHKSIVTAGEGRRRSSPRWGRSPQGPRPKGPGQNTANGAKQNGGAASAPRAAETALPAPRGRDDRRRLQRHRDLLPAGRHAGSHRRSSSLALLTKGVGILIYVVMMFVVPEANTAKSVPLPAACRSTRRKSSIAVKRQYEKGSHQWQREWRRKQRQWRAGRAFGAAAVRAPSVARRGPAAVRAGAPDPVPDRRRR